MRLGYRGRRAETAASSAFAAVAIAGALLASAGAVSAEAACRPDSGPGSGLGVERVIEIDTQSGPLFGEITKFPRERDLLQPGEVVLTFDDGPMPAVTRSILETLERHCTRATFFPVGRMAVAYPALIRDMLARGHTVGAHTWSHPLNLKRLPVDRAKTEIERGFAAIEAAAGQPVAPFFRFPGLSDSAPLLAYLQGRGVATFTVDVVSNDSYIADPDRLMRETLAKTVAKRGGILLFHDIKLLTAKMLPRLLTELQQRGFKVVHLVAKAPLTSDVALRAEYARTLADRGRSTRPTTVAATPGNGDGAAVQPSAARLPVGVPVTRVAWAPRNFRDGDAPGATTTATRVQPPDRQLQNQVRRLADAQRRVPRPASTANRQALRTVPQPQAASAPPAGGGAWSWVTLVGAR